jgi:hypothetical protein
MNEHDFSRTEATLDPTWPTAGPVAGGKLPLFLAEFNLVFRVSMDEEYVHYQAVSDTLAIDCGARCQNYLLVTLARQRLSDLGEGFSDTSCGWIYSDDLAKKVGIPREQLNLDVFRIRRHLEARGILDGSKIIERRNGTGQVRIGTRRLAIVNA